MTNAQKMPGEGGMSRLGIDRATTTGMDLKVISYTLPVNNHWCRLEND